MWLVARDLWLVADKRNAGVSLIFRNLTTYKLQAATYKLPINYGQKKNPSLFHPSGAE